MEKKLTLIEALEAVKQGKRIIRNCWYGKGMFVFQRYEDVLSNDSILKDNSLPESVKSFLIAQNRKVVFNGCLCMYSANGKITIGWLASQADRLSTDWEVLD